MKNLLLVVLLLINLNALAQGDHLEPAEDYFNMYPHHRDYYPYLYKHLIEGLHGRPIFRVMTLPSFSPESVVSIDGDVNETEFHVIVKRGKQNIWYSKAKEKIDVETFEKPIDIQLVKIIESLFKKVSLQIRYDAEVNWGITDGTTYLVSGFVSGQGRRSGMTWSPDKGSKMDGLVDISSLLIQIAEEPSEESRRVLETQLLSKLMVLDSRF